MGYTIKLLHVLIVTKPRESEMVSKPSDTVKRQLTPRGISDCTFDFTTIWFKSMSSWVKVVTVVAPLTNEIPYAKF